MTPARFGGIVSRVSQEPDAEQRTVAILDGLGLAYDLIRIDPDFADTAAFCERYGWPPDASANTIVVASKKEPRVFCACVVLATTRLDVNGTVRRLLGVNKASFASADDTLALTGMMVGGVTPPGLPPEMPLYVDARVMDQPFVVIGGGSRSLKIKVAPAVLEKLGGQVIDGLAKPASDPLPQTK